MGMGLLMAGALGGFASGVSSVADNAIKERETEKARQLKLADRKSELLFEMEQKARIASEAEARDGQAWASAQDAADGIGEQRRRAKFASDLGVSELSPEQEQAFREHYDEQAMAVQGQTLAPYRDRASDKAGDVLTALRQGGAGGGLLKSAAEEVKQLRADEARQRQEVIGEKKLEQQERLRLEGEDRRDARQERMLAAMVERAEMANDSRERAAATRASASGKGAGGLDQTERLTVLKDVKAKADATRPKAPTSGTTRARKAYEAELTAWKESDDGQTSAMVAKRIRTLIERGEVAGEGGDTSLPSDAAVGAQSTPLSRAQADVDGIKRERERVAKDKSSATVDRLGILDDELAKAEARLKAARAAAAKPAASAQAAQSASAPAVERPPVSAEALSKATPENIASTARKYGISEAEVRRQLGLPEPPPAQAKRPGATQPAAPEKPPAPRPRGVLPESMVRQQEENRAIAMARIAQEKAEKQALAEQQARTRAQQEEQRQRQIAEGRLKLQNTNLLR